jgi:lysophospholipase L1-like esterase
MGNKVFLPILLKSPIALAAGDSLTAGFPYIEGYTAYLSGLQLRGSVMGRHEGRAGWWAAGGPEGGILAHIAEWMQSYRPNILFLMVGTNDYLNGEQDDPGSRPLRPTQVAQFCWRYPQHLAKTGGYYGVQPGCAPADRRHAGR